ncbi:hypothetical protein [Streptomyces sp. Rer75]|uniref:hypothetical protein n=1 Tax=unclassified Streptomyces TaxID=2593676 RepID=UPI0015D01A33|nr:hypothetical protein [Streptomyces sp. Rer75]QLH19909.1 hypothetical protein HYQ63_03960 [Streptomyces sp. Rer75]
MIPSAVRGIVTTAALTTALTLLPPSAAGAAAGGDIEKVDLLGVTVISTKPRHVEPGDSWKTRLKLYTEKNKKYAGNGTSRCDTVRVTAHKLVVQCTRVLRLKKGSLVLSDQVTHKGHATATAKTAIVGGTGRYHSAYGQGTITLAGPLLHFALRVDE